jgi:hypothetical protein
MKNLRLIAVIVVLAQIITAIVLSAEYYVQSLSYVGFNTIQLAFHLLQSIFLLIVGIVYLVNNAQHKAYSMFRFIFIITGVLLLPQSLFGFFEYRAYYYYNGSKGYIALFREVLSLGSIVLLFLAKPEKTVPKINLYDYELVSYTSTGHRFINYLLDLLVILPVAFYYGGLIGSVMRLGDQMTLRLAVAFVSVLYYLLSESIFRQTFGKMVTNSCVVSNGHEFTTARIFGRSLCRLIPLDGIAFLFGGKWHDKISRTEVVYVDSWETPFAEFTEDAVKTRPEAYAV